LSLNLKKLGYYGYASYNIKVSSKNWVNEVFEEIVKIPNVIAALKLLGTYDINAVAPFSSPSQLMGIYGAISRITGIEKIDQQIGNSMEMWPGR
jgi:DNA-binding Lrp family transcriptional regulator